MEKPVKPQQQKCRQNDKALCLRHPGLHVQRDGYCQKGRQEQAIKISIYERDLRDWRAQASGIDPPPAPIISAPKQRPRKHRRKRDC